MGLNDVTLWRKNEDRSPAKITMFGTKRWKRLCYRYGTGLLYAPNKNVKVRIKSQLGAVSTKINQINCENKKHSCRLHNNEIVKMLYI
jgi:opacity protein-like surface antigen